MPVELFIELPLCSLIRKFHSVKQCGLGCWLPELPLVMWNRSSGQAKVGNLCENVQLHPYYQQDHLASAFTSANELHAIYHWNLPASNDKTIIT